ncbi:von Willebrand factor type A domain protein [Pseudarthrobacter siccitolerans]|uniref:von Willebrand factor type A domain protein n=1 Tax=Pseudarthrobacter siccitolerans TaxID=861266 RepID=A0A024H1X8_9MICC|nr:vWA domain-containing protein [Pseudarthrobacter siccitolerans]CCQ45872.1 von Willebrand factor type A domain protein [Pseudarthrobacter siccitolerans]
MTLLPVLPWWILLPVIAVALLFMVWRIVLERLRPGGRAWVRRSVLVLLVAAAALRPGVPGGSVQAATADLNVFFVVDTTSSMVAEDYGNAAPRLAGVRQDIMAIAEELPGARFSVITFDTEARVRMPLTADTSALETITAILEPQVTVYAKGSSITAAREVLAERLSAAKDSHPGRPRLVFYLGDGEQTSATEPAPLTLDDGLVAGGAVLGYGTSSGGRMKENTGMESDAGSPYIQDFTGSAARDALSVIDEDRLRGIAAQLGVPYVHRSDGDAASAMLQEARPGALERTSEDSTLTGRTEVYWLLAAAAFVLGLLEMRGIIRQLREVRLTGSPLRAPHGGQPREGAR